jgi:hypothetical protein
MEPELAKALQRAQGALAVSPEYDLDSGHTFAIGQAIGPLVDRQGVLNLPQSRRIRLLIITCAKILPLWEFHWPRLLLPHQLLTHMAAYLVHTATLAQVEQRAEALLLWVDTQPDDPFQHSGYGVGLTVYKAYEALETVVGQGDGDRSAEAHAGVSLRFAAHTAALDHPLHGQVDPIRRGNFWEWWLTRAIPICLRIPPET